jgi:hypothetical protein
MDVPYKFCYLVAVFCILVTDSHNAKIFELLKKIKVCFSASDVLPLVFLFTFIFIYSFKLQILRVFFMGVKQGRSH